MCVCVSGGTAHAQMQGTLRTELYAFDDAPLSAVQTQNANRIELDLSGKFALSDRLSFTLDGTIGTVDSAFSRIDKMGVNFDIGPSAVSLGYNTLAWSKSEFSRLSNVTNPADYRFDPSGKTTIGQPMVRWDVPVGVGVITAVAIPKTQDARYPTATSRLRSFVPVTGAAQYEKPADTPAYALRYAASIGIADIGLYGYVGPSREAAIVTDGQEAAPYYAWVQQVGLDAQMTFGSVVGKFELRHTENQLNRNGVRDTGLAASIGGEYAFYGVFGSPSDITAAVEYTWDERGVEAWRSTQNDLFAGLRWSLQNTADTQFKIGVQKDFDFDTAALRLGFEHRIVDGLVVKSDAVFWQRSDPADLAFGLSQDSYLRLTLEQSF